MRRANRPPLALKVKPPRQHLDQHSAIDQKPRLKQQHQLDYQNPYRKRSHFVDDIRILRQGK